MSLETTRALNWAAGLSIVTGLVHGALANDHFEEWWVYGVFFMFAAIGQAIYGFGILGSHMMNGVPIREGWKPSARLGFYALGIALNLGLLLMYVQSRTFGVPLGPEAGEVEPWDPLGLFTKALELVVVVLLVRLWLGARMASNTRTVAKPA